MPQERWRRSRRPPASRYGGDATLRLERRSVENRSAEAEADKEKHGINDNHVGQQQGHDR